MRKIVLFLLVFLSYSVNAQMVPSFLGVYDKKLDPDATGTVNFTNCGASEESGPSQSDCNTSYSGTSLEGDVTLSSGIQSWTVPYTATYTITAIGATAGNEGQTSVEVGHPAKITGDFNLTKGDVLKILVGQHGWKASCRPGWGAGGGTFVTENDNTILVIAGGCGSGHMNNANTYDWQNASTGESGVAESGKTHSAGSNGNGGGGTSSGGGGAGYSGNGTTGNSATFQLCTGVATSHSIPQAFLNGGVGDRVGGGFGGGAGVTNTWGGGGGGYSGGAGSNNSPYFGGGGGSKNNGSNQTNTLHDNDRNTETDGSVTISW